MSSLFLSTTSRDIPIVPDRAALLFIDVQNFSCHPDGAEWRDMDAAELAEKKEPFLRQMQDDVFPKMQALQRAPARRGHRGDVHHHRKPDEGRPRPEPRLQDHRVQRAQGQLGRPGVGRDRAGRRRDRAAEIVVLGVRVHPHRLHPAQPRASRS
jgi:hypothetical protein